MWGVYADTFMIATRLERPEPVLRGRSRWSVRPEWIRRRFGRGE